MKSRRLLIVSGVLLAALWLASPARPQDKAAPTRGGALSGALRDDLLAISPDEHIQRLATIRSRVTGYPGCAEAEDYVRGLYESMGLSNVRREPFHVIVPFDRGASLTVGGEEITLHCLWPNYVRTPKTSEAGIEGPLVWGGEGYLNDFNGKDVMGSIVVMKFDTATRWLNAAKLGARAIIFVEPDNAFRTDAEQKYSLVPVPVPRYYLTRADLPALAAVLRDTPAGFTTEDEALPMVEALGTPGQEPVSGRVRADMQWEEVQVHMIVGEVPGSDPDLASQTLACHAYYDSISVVPALAPGAESACGVAAQIEIAELLLKHPPRRTVQFLATPGHFQALAGARQYAFKTIYPQRREVTGVAATETTCAPHCFVGLDLSSRHRGLAGFYKGNFYDHLDGTAETPIQNIFGDLSLLLLDWSDEVLGAEGIVADLDFSSGIVPQHGRDWRSLLPDLAAFDAEIVTISGRPGITLATTGDPRNAVNTPLDTFARIKPYLANVRNQAIVSAYLIKRMADVPVLPVTDVIKPENIGSIFGRAIEQTLSDYVPTINVPDVVVGVELSDTKSMLGVAGRAFVRSDAQGLFEVFGVKKGNVICQGFKLSSSTGAIEAAAPPEQAASVRRKRAEWDLRETDVRLNLFQGVSTTLFDLIHPLRLAALPIGEVLRGDSNSGLQKTELIQFVGKAVKGTSYNEPVAVVFTKKNRRLKVVTAAGPLLAVNAELTDDVIARGGRAAGLDEDSALGIGVLAEQAENFVYMTAYRFARDVFVLDEERLATLARAAISKKNVSELHETARGHLRSAGVSLSEKRYDEFYRYVRLAWGTENLVYPEVRGTAHDVVAGVIFYFALLLPFVIFAERLLFNIVDIRKKLAMLSVLFVICYGVLMLVHPAFRLSKTPIIILDGFFMLVAALWTIYYLILKFQTSMEFLRRHIDTIHRADVARASAAMAAFILGISNMRKRKVRTFLTALTLILLTFTILSFTSFETEPAAMLRYESNKAAPYEGVLIRSLAWAPLGEAEANDVVTHFRTEGMNVAVRSWFVNRRVGEELKLEISRVDAPGSAVAIGMLGLTPDEDAFSGVSAMVEEGEWFAPTMQDWPFVCALPKGMADSLRISAEDVGTAWITVAGRHLRVVAVLDSAEFGQYEDLDEEPLTPATFRQTQAQQAGGGAAAAAPSFSAAGGTEAEDFIAAKGGESEEAAYIHMEADRVLIVPNELCLKLGGSTRSIAAGPGRARAAGAEAERDLTPAVAMRSFEATLEQFASRVRLALFAGLDGKVNRVATHGRMSMGGLQGLMVPILIASLIVFNTMLGAVYERVTEIKVYASVGLAPIHIGALFLAESSVFAVVGAMMGYLLGQGVSFVLAYFPTLMEGISLNYSSISAVWSAMLVIGVVLASTAYPARMAGKLSVPDETRKMAIPKPTSDIWDIRFPFTVSSKEALGVMAYLRQYLKSNDEDSVGAFTADNIDLRAQDEDGTRVIALDADVWVAPLDMGISQNVIIRSVPDPEEPEMTYLFFTITRKSGEFATWHRMNLGFLKDLRKQLLIWRLVTHEAKQKLTGEAAQLLGLPCEPPPAPAEADEADTPDEEPAAE